MRVGWGFDAHRFGGPPPVVLGGVRIPSDVGVEATSDGDVAAHAVADALLGAANLGDLGAHFPSADPRWAGADSLDLLRTVVSMATAAGLVPAFCDVTVIAERVRVAPHREEIRAGIAEALRLPPAAVSIKATTTDGLGMIGRGEGLAAVAVVTAVEGTAAGSGRPVDASP